MSLPLLLERRTPGMGPKAPLQTRFAKVVVEGLKGPDRVVLYADGFALFVSEDNGTFDLKRSIESGSVCQAELEGDHSCVSVRLEK